jgi:serine/threonine protein phosphatase PrpC
MNGGMNNGMNSGMNNGMNNGMHSGMHGGVNGGGHNHHSVRQPQRSPTSSLRWSSGFCTRLGPRNSNEDRLVALPNLTEALTAGQPPNASPEYKAKYAYTPNKHPTSRQGFFAVYDGHCGDQASTHLQENLHYAICCHPSYQSDIERAIIETCVQTDKDFLAECRAKKQYCGTTALGAFVRGSQLIVFNIGDCQAVLSTNGVAVS